MNIKELISKVLQQDAMLQDALQAIKDAAPSFKDLFSGTFSEKLKVLVKGFATFAVLFEKNCLERYGMTREQVIDELSAYLDEKITLPWYAEYFDGPIFHWLIEYAMNYVRGESAITVAYAAAIVEAETETA